MTTVRPLSTEDRAAWQPLWDGYLRFYRAEPTPAWSDATFAALTGSRTDLTGLLAVSEDLSEGGSGARAVGLAHLVFHASTWSTQPKCYLNDLFVAPSARGSGAARALIEATYATARAHGCADVYWHTQEYNHAARSLYDGVAALTSFRVYEHTLAPAAEPTDPAR